jgi:hypothetical protein
MKAHRNVICCAFIALLASSAAAQHADQQLGGNPFEPPSHPTLQIAADGHEHADSVHQQTAESRVDGDPIIVRVYDVSDLLVIPGDYPAKQESELTRESTAAFPPLQSRFHAGSQPFGGMGGGFGGMGGMGMQSGSGTQGGGFFQVPDRVSVSQPSYFGQMASSESAVPALVVAPVWGAAVDDLIEAITSVIQPESWSEVGGEGNITVVGQSLVIGQTDSVQDQVAAFLQELRQNRAERPTLIVQVDWLWQTAQQHARWLQQSRVPEPYGSVPVEEWQAWRSLPAPEGLHHYTASIRCFSGQTVHVQAGQQRLYVTGMTPVVGSEPGYNPQVSLAQEGAVLQVTPALSADGEQLTLDLHSRVTRRTSPDAPARPTDVGVTVTMGNVPQQTASAVDRPVLEVQRLSTTTRLPLNLVTFIGGMTFAPGHDASDLYVYVLVTRP